MEDTFDLRKYLSEGTLLKEDCGCGCADCEEKSQPQPQKIALTLEEQRAVVKMVMESSYKGVTLTEAKTNTNLKEEILLNLKFYNGYKQATGSINEAEGMPWLVSGIKSVLSWLGNIKDYLTGTKIVKSITEFISEIWGKLKNWLAKQIDKFIPQKYQDIASLTIEDFKDSIKGMGDLLKKAINFIADALSYKGLAWLLAALKDRTFYPSEEQKECLIPLAQSIMSLIYKILVYAFIAKVVLIIGLAVAGNPILGVPAGAAWTSYILPVIAKIGGAKGAAWVKYGKTAGSTLSAFSKGKDAKKYQKQVEKISKEIDLEKENGEEKSKTTWGKLWNNCPKTKDKNIASIDPSGEGEGYKSPAALADIIHKTMKGKRSKYKFVTWLRGIGTDEEALIKSLEKMNQSDKLKKETIKWYEAQFNKKLIDDVKGELSGKDLEKALNLLK